MQRTDGLEGKRQRRANRTKVLSNTVRNKRRNRELVSRQSACSLNPTMVDLEALLLRNAPRQEWWSDRVFVCAPKEVKGMS
jgi:hypothetical protein